MASKEITGVVVSNKMEKTVVVAVERQVRHDVYGKTQRRTSKFMAHNEANDAGVGDRVAIVESRPLSRREFLDQVTEGVGTEPAFTWVDQEFLEAQEVEPWHGPRAIPVWLPMPEYAGMLAHDVSASYAAGLRTRPLADTARDTLAWLRETPEAAVSGISRTDEAEVLAAWHAAQGSRQD